MENPRHRGAAASAAAAETNHSRNSGHSNLHAAKQLFDLVHHRNKNQHRHSVWWRHFAALRRTVGKLVQEIEVEEEDKACTRARFLDARLIPKCYLSFTQLIHDNQFSALGLVLLAALARVRWACSDFIVASSSARGTDTATASSTKSPPLDRQATGGAESFGGEDTGEVMARTEPDMFADASDRENSLLGQTEQAKASGDMLQSSRTPTKELPVPALAKTTAKGRKDRRRRANAIDALFQGLA